MIGTYNYYAIQFEEPQADFKYGGYHERTLKKDGSCYICGHNIPKGEKVYVVCCSSIMVTIHLACKDEKPFKEIDEETWAP